MCPGSLIVDAGWSDFSLSCLLFQSHGLDWCFVYCLEIKKHTRDRGKKDEMQAQRKKKKKTRAGKSMQSCQHQELIRSRSQMQQMAGECKRNWAIKFLTKHLEGCRGKWEERRDWRCMRGLKEPRRKDSEWLENKKCPSQQYVLAYGYTCSNATLIMQSCLPCQLTGLVVQKLYFAYSDTGSKSQKWQRTDSYYHQHSLDSAQPRREKRQREDKRRDRN